MQLFTERCESAAPIISLTYMCTCVGISFLFRIRIWNLNRRLWCVFCMMSASARHSIACRFGRRKMSQLSTRELYYIARCVIVCMWNYTTVGRSRNGFSVFDFWRWPPVRQSDLDRIRDSEKSDRFCSKPPNFIADVHCWRICIRIVCKGNDDFIRNSRLRVDCKLFSILSLHSIFYIVVQNKIFSAKLWNEIFYKSIIVNNGNGT